jgi:hypothetical protein
MNTNQEHCDSGSYDSNRLTHQQQRFCDEYLTHFNAFKAAVNSGYSENTSRKGALLHVPKIQHYLKEAMNRRSQRLEITHDMILRELSKIAFSNMGNYYDEYACLKRMNELTVDEKAAISFYDITEVQDGEGYRVGMQSRIKLHNKMSALDKIARHLGFYGVAVKQNQEPRIKTQDEESLRQESPKSESPEVRKMDGGSPESGVESLESEVASRKEDEVVAAVVDRGTNNLPMDYPVEDFELEGIELKTLRALEEVNISPGRPEPMIEGDEESPMSESREVGKMGEVAAAVAGEPKAGGGVQKSFPLQASTFQLETRNIENILTISPLAEELKRLNLKTSCTPLPVGAFCRLVQTQNTSQQPASCYTKLAL